MGNTIYNMTFKKEEVYKHPFIKMEYLDGIYKRYEINIPYNGKYEHLSYTHTFEEALTKYEQVVFDNLMKQFEESKIVFM